ncbi:BspA family leucine-rich repeat surface protein, partial [Lactococcus piscium]
PMLWGDAPYTFDIDTGVLIISPGSLDKTENAPWKLTDNRKIDADKIKKISFTGVTKAPEDSQELFKSLSSLAEIVGLTNLDTSNITTMLNMFRDCSSLVTLDLSNFNTEKVTDTRDMFRNCTSLTTLDLSKFNTKKVIDMRGMFRDCTSFKSLDLSTFDTSAVTEMNKLFENVPLVSLTLGESFTFVKTDSKLSKPQSLFSTSDLQREGKYLTGNWIKKDNQSAAYDTEKFMTNYGKGDLKAGTYVAEIMSLTWGDAPWDFDSNTGILTINSGTLDKPENAPWKLTGNRKVDADKIKKINFTGATKAPTNCSELFKALNNLTEFENLTYLDTSEVINMDEMFYDCYNLKQLDLSNFNTSKVTSIIKMFFFCTSLESLDLSKFNTKNMTDMTELFQSCKKLKTLDLSGFDTENVKKMAGMFNDTILSSLTLGDAFRFVGENSANLPKPTARNAGEELTGKWIKENRGSYPQSPAGFMQKYGTKDLTAGTYVAEIKAPRLWGDAPWTFDKNTGTLTIESGRLTKSNESPWKRTDDDKIDGTKIKKIIFTGPVLAPEDSTELFRKLTSLTEFENLTYLDTSDVTNMTGMFYDCYHLKQLDLSSFNTEKVTRMVDMFFYCSSLESLDLSNFETSRVTDMSGLVKACQKLKTLDLSRFSTLYEPKMKDMFKDTALSSLTLGNYFRFVGGTDVNLSQSQSQALREGIYLTGRWFKKGRPSFTYTVDDFTTNYGKDNLRAGTYIAETKPLLWGEAPYTFDTDTGVLTVNPGNLDVTEYSPWKRDDTAKINKDQIKKIIFTGKTKAPKSSSDLFAYLTSLKEIVGLDKLDTSDVVGTNSMFKGCTMLESLDLSNWDTSNLVVYGAMFENCISLKKLDISSFIIPPRDTWGLSTMRIFTNCDSLASLTLGDRFLLHKGMDLPDPKALNSWERSTGNWIRKDGNSGAYSTKDFVANYGENNLTAGTYIAEVNPNKWGDAIWTFDPDTGILTVNSGTLEAGSTTSPWKRTDGQNIDANSVKQIIFTGKTQAPENSDALFSDLSNLTEIVNLTNLDTSKATRISRMFIGCKSLKTLDLSQYDTSQVTNMDGMFQDCISLTKLDLSSFDTGKVTTMQKLFKNTPLASLTLGVKFTSMGTDADLPIPTALNEGDQLTGNWVRENGKSKAYSPKNFMANYGKGDLQAGTYVGELISSGAILETNISFSTDSGKTGATTAVIGDQLQAKLTVKHTADSPEDSTSIAVKLSTISLLTDAWALSPTVTVTTFDQTGKQTASNEQTIKNDALNLPVLPYGSYFEITLTGTAWEKAYAIPSGNCNYTLSYKNQAGDQKVEKSNNFVINSGALGLKSVPNISFKDNILPTKSNQIIDRKDADYAISVTDYRGTRLPDGETAKPDRVNWEITATASPFKDAAGKEIKLSTMAVSFTKAIGQTTELGADATLVTSHDVTGETAKQNNLTKLSWAKELGFKAISHNRSGLNTTKYTADVEFDLRTAP